MPYTQNSTQLLNLQHPPLLLPQNSEVTVSKPNYFCAALCWVIKADQLKLLLTHLLHLKDTNTVSEKLPKVFKQHYFCRIIILTSSSSSSMASPVKYSTDRGTMRSRKKWPISKSAARIASESSSCTKQHYLLNHTLTATADTQASFVARCRQIPQWWFVFRTCCIENLSEQPTCTMHQVGCIPQSSAVLLSTHPQLAFVPSRKTV